MARFIVFTNMHTLKNNWMRRLSKLKKIPVYGMLLKNNTLNNAWSQVYHTNYKYETLSAVI